ncbi:F0F1 ATP synthase subunit A [Desulfobacca acetoxidans]|uniref:ATP synthase subunit a n=1 Tax=Desulfobacca acetoxidans (strain ATCC 700848 / DSM 11109 / ASRB2) TaxID=880072 RepID=F2NE55_DESAR|nr:F0F1 ATP synthase subunit A [Desulfobacca acetoxidans]AEB10685.1 ATP synthase subunit a [Desulfobacca acetoxidans DSM 11109]
MEHPILILDVLQGMFGLHIPPHVTYSWLIMAILVGLGYLAAKPRAVVPAGGQSFFELLIGGLEEFMVDITGEEGRSFFPFIATIFIYIWLCNLIGLLPGFLSPTSNINTPLSMALCVFIFTHYLGVKYHGVKYIKHFTGPLPALAPLFLPIEIIGHSARVLSLTLRLFGNIMGEDLVLAILLLLAGKFLAPLPMMFLAVFTSTVQAFIFSLLSMMYFASSMEEAH